MDDASVADLLLCDRDIRVAANRPREGLGYRGATREKVLGFLAPQPRCQVAMEVYGSAHY